MDVNERLKPHEPNQNTRRVSFHLNVPPRARARREEVLKWKKNGKGLNKLVNHWNNSVSVSDCAQRNNWKNLGGGPYNLYNYNYRAEVIPAAPIPIRPKTSKFNRSQSNSNARMNQLSKNDLSLRSFQLTEMPIHPSLNDKLAWNSCSVLLPSEKKINHESIMSKSALSSRRRINDIKNYINILERPRSIAVKSIGVELPDLELEKSYSAHRKKDWRIYELVHSGVWEYCKSEGKHMWSDTGSFEKNSPGDTIRYFDPRMTNLAFPKTR